LKRAGPITDDLPVAGDLAGTVRRARAGLQLSQAELARRTGISPSYLSRIESAAWERGGPWPADGVRLVDRNPRRGTFRSVHVAAPPGPAPRDDSPPTYVDALADRLAEAAETLLYRVCAPARHSPEAARATVDRWSAPNARARIAFANPLVMDVLIGEHEALIALPDRRGDPHLAACLVVDDPDFVDAIRRWFDEWVWEPPAGAVDRETGEGHRP
jgi:hypothetical protein